MNAFLQLGQTLANLGSSAKRLQIDGDKQVRRVKAIILENLDRDIAMDLDARVHCGYCAEACQFSIGTNDPKLVPTRKLDLMRRVYRREASSLAPLRRFFTRGITAEELVEWELLFFDNCTECGRCTTICPMGINIARGVGIMREALSAAGHTPPEVLALQQEQQNQGTFLGAGSGQLRQASMGSGRVATDDGTDRVRPSCRSLPDAARNPCPVRRSAASMPAFHQTRSHRDGFFSRAMSGAFYGRRDVSI